MCRYICIGIQQKSTCPLSLVVKIINKQSRNQVRRQSISDIKKEKKNSQATSPVALIEYNSMTGRVQIHGARVGIAPGPD
jgi:hypothetical protein